MRQILFSIALLMSLTGCASKGQGNFFGQLDMASSRMVSQAQLGVAANMTAEVVYVQDLISGSNVYRLDAGIRHGLGIEQYVLALPLGEYQIASICAEKTFAKRLAGLKGIERRSGIWWGRFQGLSGTEILLPVSTMNLTILGGENITPVNLSAISQNHCEVTYGEAKANSLAKIFPSTLQFKDKYRKKIEFYN